MTPPFALRAVTDADLPALFEQQRDPGAIRGIPFSPRDPEDRPAFLAHWKRIMGDPSVLLRVVDVDGEVAGHVVSFLRDGRREAGYLLGPGFRGRGLATRAFRELLALDPVRPLYAVTVADNGASLRVLDKCGFERWQVVRAFAPRRGVDVDQVILVLRAAKKPAEFV